MSDSRPDEQLLRVGRIEDVPPGTMVEASLEGRPIVVANIGDELVAFHNSCLHYRIRLSEGRLDDDVVTCRWHQWQYCLRNGEVLTDESPYGTFTTFPVHVEDGDVYVSRAPRTTTALRPEDADAG